MCVIRNDIKTLCKLRKLNAFYRHTVFQRKPLQRISFRNNMFDIVLIADKVCIVTYAAILP